MARRVVVIETAYTSVALGGQRSAAAPATWGSRGESDPIYRSREEVFVKAAGR